MRPPRPSRSTMFAPPQYEPRLDYDTQLTGSQLPFAEPGLPMPQQGGTLVYMPVPHVSLRGYQPYGMPMVAPMNFGPHWSGPQFSNVPPQYSQLQPATLHGPAPLSRPARLALPPPQAASLPQSHAWRPGLSAVAPAEVPRGKRTPPTQGAYPPGLSDSESDMPQPPESDMAQPPPGKRQKCKPDGKYNSGKFVDTSYKEDFGGPLIVRWHQQGQSRTPPSGPRGITLELPPIPTHPLLFQPHCRTIGRRAATLTTWRPQSSSQPDPQPDRGATMNRRPSDSIHLALPSTPRGTGPTTSTAL
jgi:hypothetical protein